MIDERIYEDEAEEEIIDPVEIPAPPVPPDPPLKAEELLDQLAAYRDELASLIKERDRIALDIIPAELRKQVADTQMEFNSKIDMGNDNIATLEAQIRHACIRNGATIKGRMLQAIYSGGKDSWDTKGLLRYGKDHPEIMQFYKPGEPYCLRIEKIKAGK